MGRRFPQISAEKTLAFRALCALHGLNLSLDFNHDNVDLPYGSFNANLVGFRLAYAFTPRIYLQSFTQYNDQTESFSTNIRFSWLGPANTGLFVVYNEGRATGDPSGLVNRAFIVKLTHQLDLGT